MKRIIVIFITALWLTTISCSRNYTGNYIGPFIYIDKNDNKPHKSLFLSYIISLKADSSAVYRVRAEPGFVFGEGVWRDYPNYIILDLDEYKSGEDLPWYTKKIIGVEYERCCIRLEKKGKNLQLNKSILRKSK